MVSVREQLNVVMVLANCLMIATLLNDRTLSKSARQMYRAPIVSHPLNCVKLDHTFDERITNRRNLI